MKNLLKNKRSDHTQEVQLKKDHNQEEIKKVLPVKRKIMILIIRVKIIGMKERNKFK
jgi:hypothetical protein